MRRWILQSKRLLAALLAAGMLAGLMPAAALAEENSPVDSGTTQTEPSTLSDETPSTETTQTTPAADGETEPTAEQEVPAEQETAGAEAGSAPVTGTESSTTAEPSGETEQNTEPSQPVGEPQSGEIATLDNTETTYIATYVNTLPAGIDWGDDVTAATFDTAWETVNATAADGTQYVVEVVPENTVYFVDLTVAKGSDGNPSMGELDTTEPYEAVKALVGDGLLNDKFDQFSPDANTWGLVENGVGTKGFSGVTTDKYATGVYGSGYTGTVEYRLTLEPGVYTLTSGHYDWWDNQNRSMKATLKTADGDLDAGSIAALGKHQSSTNSFSFTIKEEQTVTYVLTPTGPNAAAASWIGVVRTGDAPTDPDAPPTQPTLPDSFSEPLEESDGLTYATGATTAQVSGMDTVLNVNTQWDNGNRYHATVTDPSVFNSKAFTVLFDVKPTSPSGDTGITTQRTALTIGTSANSLHVLTWDGKLGYGGNSSGICSNSVALTGAVQNDWNSVAVVYHEDGDANGAVEVYINGALAGSVADLGFKFSEMSDLTSMLARTFDTNYLQEGSYDNIVVGPVALDAETAMAETAWRAYQKDNLPAVNTAALESAVAKAEELVASGLTSERLTAALAAGKALLEREDLTEADQSAIDDAASELTAAINEVNPIDITLTKEAVDTAAQNINGLTWKGWGMLNGNSTSNLLLDYKAEHPDQYWEMMEYLFGGEYPLFTHIKMEMGNDGNNSTGAEACTMRYEDEEADASRSPGFVMAADAKKINPDVKISILRWGMPDWVAQKWSSDRTGAGYEAMYKWYSETIFDAYEKYGYVLDFINPDTNETGNPDEDFIKWFANRIETETNFPEYFTQEAIDAYHNIRIIASDENKGLQIVPSMRADEDLYNAVDIIGFHYRTNATDDYVAMADVDDKEVWYSEGCATFGYTELQENKNASDQNGYGADTIGGYQSPLALVDSIPNAFMASRRSHYVFQPAIGSFYEGIQYAHKELLSARDPWSGYIHYDPALQMIAHFSRFAVTGWEDNDPTQNEIWRMISSASHGSFGGSDNEHATAGIDGDASYLTLADPSGKDFSVVFVNNTQNEKTFRINVSDLPEAATKDLTIWTTVTDSYLQQTDTVQSNDGTWLITIPAYSVVTATTLDYYNDNAHADEISLPEEGIRTEDRTVLDTDSTGKNADTTDNYLYADNFEYAEEGDMAQYNAVTGTETQVDYMTARGNEPRYMLDTHGAWVVEDGRLAQELSTSVSQWNGGDPATIVGDFRWMNYVASIDVQIPDANASVWAGLGIRSQSGMNWNQDGYTLRIYGNGKWEFYRGGSVLGSGSVTPSSNGSYQLQVAANDNVITAVINGAAVYTYEDANPMDAGRVKLSSSWNKVYFDNLAVTTIPGTIPYATSMVDGQDDSVTYEGSWGLPGPGGGSADNWYRTLSTSKAAGDSFTFTFPVEGTGFSIVGPNGGNANITVVVDGQEVETATTSSSGTRFETYMLTGLEYAKHTVTVTVNSGTLVIDALYTLGQPLEATEGALVSVTSELPELLATTVGTPVEGLPDTVTVKDNTGKETEMSVVWNNYGSNFSDPYVRTSVTGTVQGGTTAIGIPLSVSIPVEVVPAETLYFIDTVSGNPAELESTESYDVVKALLGDQLLNDKYDQLVGDGTWGLLDTDAGTKDYSSTSDKTDTGIYGHNNAAGETLTYQLTLPAGVYSITSAHREWWGMTRPMTAVVTAEDGTVLASGNINLSGSTGDIIASYTFVLDKEQKISYTLTATGTQAPVISWLGVNAVSADDLKSELIALVTKVKSDVAANQANGVVYAEQPLEAWQYTGSGATVQKDSLADLNEVLATAEALIADDNASAMDVNSCYNELQSVFDNLRTLPETNTSIPGTTGDVIQADTGLPMQAHGGSVLTMQESTANAIDLDGDGEVTDGKTVYLWYGEDKTNNTHPVDGVRCYVSTDLYNWTDRGMVLYTQDSILPIEESSEPAVTSSVGASGTGTTQSYNAMQVSQDNLEYLKSIGKMATAPEGMSESDFTEIKNFLRAYVSEFAVEPTSDHDVNWVAAAYDDTTITASSFLYPDSQDESVSTQQTTSLQLAFEALYGGYCITERPKVIYNESTQQYVMVFHADGVLYNNQALNEWVAGGCQGNCSASRYSRAMVGFATSDTPFGPFKLVNVTRMNYDLSYSTERLGEARDMTVFVDKGVDSNNDGVDDAYVIYSSEMNAKLYISLLNADYTGPIAQGDDAEEGVDYQARILSDNSREAPAMFKYNGWYYLITSGTDGWNSTAHIYYRSRNPFTGWESMGNPALNDTGKCFNTQVTYVIPVDAENGKFIYMSDRWNGNNLSDSRTIWLPIRMNVDNTISILNETDWTVDRLDQIAPVKVISDMPETVYADGSNLPDVITVEWQGKQMESRVESWSGTDVMGYTTLAATLADCVDAEGNKLQAQVTALVMPENLLYFANPGDATSEDYTAIMAASADTLRQDPTVNDGAYSEETGFGFLNDGFTVRDNGSDIYDSLRYADSDTTASLSYQFDLPEGEYEVYIGMYDPSGWYQYSDRRANIVINDETVVDNYSYVQNCPATPDTLHATAAVGADGKLNVTIAPNAATDASVQVSFIMVAGKATQRAKVTFETGEGSPIASQVVTVGSTASRPADPTRDLYIFTGWYTDAELTQTFDFSTPITGDITVYAGWKQETTLDYGELTQVPEEVADQYPTVDQLQNGMKVVAEAALQQTADGVQYYDVKLYVADENGDPILDENGQPVEVTAENFPAEGVSLTFPYPVDETTGKTLTGSDHMFTIVHLLNSGDFEVFQDSDILYTDKGMTITVHSLSPFAVAWRARPATEPEQPEPDQPSGSDHPDIAEAIANGTWGKPVTNKDGGALTNGAVVIPQTSDNLPVALLAMLAAIAAAGAVTLLVLRRRKTNR